MRVQVALNWDELEVLHRLAGTALLSKQLPNDASALRSALKKLTSASQKILCEHCRVREKRGRSRWCSRCNLYKRTYGRLPSETTLINSGPRKSRRRANP